MSEKVQNVVCARHPSQGCPRATDPKLDPVLEAMAKTLGSKDCVGVVASKQFREFRVNLQSELFPGSQ